MKSYFLAGACVLALGGTAQAALITNGSFEMGSLVQPFSTVTAGQTNITGWTVTKGSVDYIGNYWQAADGVRSLDMSGTNAGTIAQSFATTVGKQYVLSFAMAGNPDDAPSVKQMTVNVGIAGGLYTFQTVPGFNTKSNMGWVTDSLTFTATNATTTLQFSSDNNTAYGPALDNVMVSAVPLPPALPLFGGALLALGAFAYTRRRKTGSEPAGFALAI